MRSKEVEVDQARALLLRLCRPGADLRRSVHPEHDRRHGQALATPAPLPASGSVVRLLLPEGQGLSEGREESDDR